VSTLLESLRSPFFQRALLESVLVGAITGIVGVHVLLRRLPFFVVAMSHATFPGIVLALTVLRPEAAAQMETANAHEAPTVKAAASVNDPRPPDLQWATYQLCRLAVDRLEKGDAPCSQT